MPTNLPNASELTQTNEWAQGMQQAQENMMTLSDVVAEARRRYQILQEPHDFFIDSLSHMGTEVDGSEPIAMKTQIFHKYYERLAPLSEISVTVSASPSITKFRLGVD